MPEPTGRIFDIQRFSLHDGPGIRSTVFLKGCPLRCLWCHNPEGMSAGRQVSFAAERCIGCGECISACQANARHVEAARSLLDRARCTVCGACAAACPSQATEMIGREVTVDEVLTEVLKDRPFYETTGGGMTVSGGEPLAQAPFTAALLAAAGQAGLHRAVETSGWGDYEPLARLVGLAELFLFDLKETCPRRHVEFTGVGNETILRNLQAMHDAGARIILRLPIIPGLNDREDHFRAVAELCRSLPRLASVEVLAYHDLGAGKLSHLSMPRRLPDRCGMPDAATIAGWQVTLASLGAPVAAERTL